MPLEPLLFLNPFVSPTDSYVFSYFAFIEQAIHQIVKISMYYYGERKRNPHWLALSENTTAALYDI